MKKILFLSLIAFSSLILPKRIFAATFEEACSVLSAETPVTGDFVQKRTIAANGRTLKSSGVFTVSKEKIVWQTQKPVKNTVTITQGKIQTTDSKGKTTVLDSQQNQMFELISKMMGSLFSGNRAELEEYFYVDFFTDDETGLWNMKLSPKDSTVSQAINFIRLCGNDTFMVQMETVQSSGDSILYEFTNAQTSTQASGYVSRP